MRVIMAVLFAVLIYGGDTSIAHAVAQAPFQIMHLGGDIPGAPFAALRTDFPESVPTDGSGEILFLVQEPMEAGGSPCNPPNAAALAERLHKIRPASWKGVVFLNAEIGCFRKIRGDSSGLGNPAAAAAYDAIFAAWVRAFKAAWPNALFFQYFLPGNSYFGMEEWPADGTAPTTWKKIADAQRESIKELDGFAPEYYWWESGITKVDSQIEKYRRATAYMVKTWPDKLIAPVIWTNFYNVTKDPIIRSPCELSEAQGRKLIDALYDAGAHGLFQWDPNNTLCDNGTVHQNASANIFKSYRSFLTANKGRAVKHPGPATFIQSKGPFGNDAPGSGGTTGGSTGSSIPPINGPCNTFESGSTPPAGYGAAWNPFSSARELLVSATCAGGVGTLVRYAIGSGDLSQYVYNKSYYYKDNQWRVVTLAGTLAPGSSDWLTTPGTTNGYRQPDPHYFVGYVCHWRIAESTWKCGCRDQACVTNYWQLQADKM